MEIRALFPCRLAAFAALLAFAAACLAAPSRVADAVMRGENASVKTLLARKADVNAPQADGTTALHWAASRGDHDLAAALIRAGANVKAVNQEGSTVLSLAAASGKGEIVKALLAAGADANEIVLQGETALMSAARVGNQEGIQALLARGANVNAAEGVQGQTALMWAALEDHADVVRFLLEHGADVNAQTKMIASRNRRARGSQQGGLTALLFAARQNSQEALKALLAAPGIDRNQTEASGATALVVAILNGHYGVARTLLDAGVDPNIADKVTGRTALYAAVDMHTVEYSERPVPEQDLAECLRLIEALLAHGAKPNVQTTAPVRCRSHCFDGIGWIDRTGATPLFRAAEANDVEAIRLLLAHGADPKITTADRTTTLMAAAGVGHTVSKYPVVPPEQEVESVRLFLDRGVDPEAANADGYTALHGAAHKGSDAVIQYLATQGVKLDPIDNEGRTPVRVADASHLSGLGGFAHPSAAKLMRELMAERKAH